MVDLVAHMVSCARSPNYAADSVRHFRAGSDLHLTVFVDGDSDTYLGKCDDVSTVVAPVIAGAPSAAQAYERCRLNTIRAVKAVPQGADLLLLEDDIALSRNWHERLTKAIAVCHEKFDSDFVLSLYSATKPGRKEGPVAWYHYRDYYGNVAVVLSCGAVRRFLTIAQNTDVPSDMIVKEMLWKSRIPLRQTSPNLAQHLGDTSTTGVCRVIRSASFGGPFAYTPPAKERPAARRSIRHARRPQLGDFSISQEHLEWLTERLPEGSTILELGSGDGTAFLCERWKVHSVEHDHRFVGMHPSRYIYAPIVDGWYNPRVLRRELPSEYDLLLVDGPPGRIGRRSLLDHLALFRDDVPFLVDDTHRAQERRLARKLADVLRRDQQVFSCKDGRTFTVLEPSASKVEP